MSVKIIKSRFYVAYELSNFEKKGGELGENGAQRSGTLAFTLG